MHDVVIVGGGVIGLSLAYQLASQQQSVCLLERTTPGREASWAGAGLIPPTAAPHDPDPLRAMIRFSAQRHAQWARRLTAETQIDNGYRRCGAVYVARSPDAVDTLERQRNALQREDVAVSPLDPEQLSRELPALASRETILAAQLLPGEAQIRNPWHLRALVAACQKRGVKICCDCPASDLQIRGDRIAGVWAQGELFAGDQVCLTSGCWTGMFAQSLGLTLPLRPVRGQMVLLRQDQPLLSRILNEGPHYLLPREDGRLLVGSTMEEVGYDKRTTLSAVSGLLEFALGLVPALGSAEVEQTWAGLRPATPDGLPYLDQVPGIKNAWIATGHFRLGLTLAPATAEAMAARMLGEPPPLDLSAFRVGRLTTDA